VSGRWTLIPPVGGRCWYIFAPFLEPFVVCNKTTNRAIRTLWLLCIPSSLSKCLSTETQGSRRGDHSFARSLSALVTSRYPAGCLPKDTHSGVTTPNSIESTVKEVLLTIGFVCSDFVTEPPGALFRPTCRLIFVRSQFLIAMAGGCGAAGFRRGARLFKSAAVAVDCKNCIGEACSLQAKLRSKCGMEAGES